MIPQLLESARKIVVKFGSSTLTREDGHIDYEFMAEFAAECAKFSARGKQFVIVSSGAQAAGLSTMNKWARKKDIHYRQALCAVGQVELMNAWRHSFEPCGRQIAQILLTRDDFGDQIRTLNMRNTLFTLLDEGIIPIINENDTVYVEEIKIGDNDTLAAQSAVLWGAELLILFSDIDGVYSENPQINKNAAFIHRFDNPGQALSVGMEGTSALGTGGIETKINAAKLCFGYGIPSIITRGKPAALLALAEGRQRGTVFASP
ncbi:MAG: glutamate 5-kinase [Spirochaetaceae bacterium]|nr:glutamate 5-kinase [Spirochaetaceae bacterium]